MKSLKQKIILPVVLVALTGMTILTFVTYQHAYVIIINNVEEIAQNKVEKLVVFAEENIAGWVDTITILSSVNYVLENDFTSLQKYVDKTEVFQEFTAVIMADVSGNYKGTNGGIGNIKDRPYFDIVMNGDIAISDPIISKSTGKPIIVVASPIIDSSGEVTGLIGATIELTKITEIVNTEKLGHTGYAFMLTSDGMIMAHPEEKVFLKYEFIENQSQSLTNIVSKMTKGETGVGSYEFEGIEKIISFAPIKSTGWSIGMTTFYSEVKGSLINLGRTVSLIGSIIVLAIASIIYLLVSHSIKPALDMVEITQAVAAGDLSVKVEVMSNDEIGILATNFNNMIDGMRSLVSETSEMSNEVVMKALRANNHEFMNKLHVILGLIQMKEYDEAKRFIVDAKKHEKQIMNQITKQIKDPTIAGLLLGKMNHAKELGIDLKVDTRTNLDNIHGNISSHALMSVVGNLVENSLEALAGKKNDNKLVSLLLVEKENLIHIEVSDNGHGIPTKNQKQILKRGYTTKGKSRGIGLSIVRNIVSEFNGRINIESEFEKGTKFEIILMKEGLND